MFVAIKKLFMARQEYLNQIQTIGRVGPKTEMDQYQHFSPDIGF